MAKFENTSCTTTGVEQSDRLLFTCTMYAAVLLRVVLPTGEQEIISSGDTVANVNLPPGFNVESLDITEIDDTRRNFNLTLSIDSASHLKSGNITCDNTTIYKEGSQYWMST